MKAEKKLSRIIFISSAFLVLICGFFGFYFLWQNIIHHIVYNQNLDRYTCTYKNQKRSYILCLPNNFEEKTVQQKSQIPLIIMLHGYGSTAQLFMRQTDFANYANSKNYGVLFISGTINPKIPGSDSGWHYGDNKLSKNDINFILKLAAKIQKQHGLSKKIFITGFSNGAFMANKIALQKNNKITAIASIGGMIPENVWKNKPKNLNVGFLQINGTKDSVVPMKTMGTAPYNLNPPIEEVLEYFRKANRLPNKKETEILSSKATKYTFSNKVTWILIDNETHRWPSDDFSKICINKEIIDFFDNF